MSTAMTLLSQVQIARAQMPEHLRNRLAGPISRALGAGITSGFAVVSLRGKNWRIKHQGAEQILYEPGTKRPAYDLRVVIVDVAEAISKIWYQEGYKEGSIDPPDCWSANGKVPDPASPKLQSPTCAGCKWNAWGSARRQDGTGKGKDCADSKRLAVVPAGNVDNEAYGGAMLMRVPPASLGMLKQYDGMLAGAGINFFEVETIISFDPEAEYPRIKFEFGGMLDADRLEKVIMQRDSGLLKPMLSAPIEEVHTDGVDTSHVQPAAPAQQMPQQPPAGVQAGATVPLVLPQHAQPAPAAAAPVPAVDPAPTPVAVPAPEPQPAPIPPPAAAPEPVPAVPTVPAEAAPEPVNPVLQVLLAAGVPQEQAEAMVAAMATPKPEAAPVTAHAATAIDPVPTPKPRATKPKPAPAAPVEAAAPPTANGVAADEPQPGAVPEGFDDLVSGLLAS